MQIYQKGDAVVRLSDDEREVIILDQTRLPGHEEYLRISDEERAWTAIKRLEIRGAPAIGVFAGYAMYVLAQRYADRPYPEFLAEFRRQAEYLNSSRPTAVNLSWALRRQTRLVEAHESCTGSEIVKLLGEEAHRIDAENEEMTRKIAEYGVTLIKDGDGILTHCNAGYLACLGYGTATAPIYYGAEQGMTLHVYSDETRPLLQGARLTSFELQKAGIDVTLICDNMASIVMKQGRINAVFVGCDRIAANGDFANKIGTSGVAILAKYYGIPFYTLGPSSTIDFDTPTGADIARHRHGSVRGEPAETVPEITVPFRPQPVIRDSPMSTATCYLCVPCARGTHTTPRKVKSHYGTQRKYQRQHRRQG